MTIGVRWARRMAVVLGVAASLQLAVAGEVFYVDSSRPDGGDGVSWPSAFNDLQDALTAARDRAPADSDIWVAAGTYKPTHPYGARATSFDLPDGVGIYGGFPVGGGSWEQRDPSIYETILSGDIYDDDGPEWANNDDNSFHVVTVLGSDVSAVLDGCTITKGNANRAAISTDRRGGGMLISSGTVTIVNCRFVQNFAYSGGAIYCSNDRSVVFRCQFLRNFAANGGGGICSSSSDALFVNCSFVGNQSSTDGGGAYSSSAQGYFANCVFVGNRALGSGGGMYNSGDGATVANCTFTENASTGPGCAIFEDRTWHGVIRNCILWRNAVRDGQVEFAKFSFGRDVGYSCVDGGLEGEGNIDKCPQFVLPVHQGPDGVWGTADDQCDVRIAVGSPCIDAGACLGVPRDTADIDADGDVTERLPLDFAGEPRFEDDYLAPDFGESYYPYNDVVDMGVYEGGVGNVVLSESSLVIDDSATKTITARLASYPTEPVTLTIEKVEGDAGIVLLSPKSLEFTQSNYRKVQEIRFYAIHDENTLNESAVFEIRQAGECVRTIDIVTNDDEFVTYHVDDDVPDGGDGLTWATAFNDLQDALAEARLEGKEFAEIRVAAGTYTPAEPDGDRNISFDLIGGLRIYGGFPDGGGTWDQRDPTLHETILSGDLNGDDQSGIGNSGENAYHVVKATDLDRLCIFDGFTVVGGNANGSTVDNAAEGGGICADSSCLQISNCRFSRNAAVFGGAIHFTDCPSKITNCLFEDNTVEQSGGAVSLRDGDSVVRECFFVQNSAFTGGALSLYQGTTVAVNCRFTGNMATGDGGGIRNYGTFAVANSTFIGNHADGDGGAIRTEQGFQARIVNCVVTRNSASNCGGAVWADFGYVLLANSILWKNFSTNGNHEVLTSSTGSRMSVVHCCISGGHEGDGNIHADPQFVAAPDPGSDGVWGTADDYGDCRVAAGSPCIDAGDNTFVSLDAGDLDGDYDLLERLPLDQQGFARFQNDLSIIDSGNADLPDYPAVVDIGAFEGGSGRILVDHHPVIVSEGNVSSVNVSLKGFLFEPVTVSVVKRNGDPDIALVSEATFVFESSSGASPQQIRFHAADDDDIFDGRAVFEMRINGCVVRTITVIEDDDESTIVYVDDNAPVGGDGMTWNTAFNDLHDAIGFVAQPGLTEPEIWMAEGVYKPAPAGGSREETFRMIAGIELFGGFPDGGGTWQDRDPERYATILSGDLNGDDESGFVNNEENSYNVVTFEYVQRKTILDGFTITAGNADGQWPFNVGGGIRNYYSDVSIRQCKLVANYGDLGGGIYSYRSIADITNTSFIGNSAFYGGGVRNESLSDVVITNCVFRENHSDGIIPSCTLGLSQDASAPNVTWRVGGDESESGAAISNNGTSLIVTNCTFASNVATNGASCLFNSFESASTLTNCIFWGNESTDNESPFFGDVLEIPVTFCCVQGGWDGAGNIDTDPLFVRMPDAGVDGEWGTEDDDHGDLHLSVASPCIDAGNNAALGLSQITDRDGNLRRFDDPLIADTGLGTAPLVDMGAYEAGSTTQAIIGDTNCDGIVDVYDIDSFVNALVGEVVYYAAYPDCERGLADCNGDGCIDVFDIDAFVAILVGNN